jgi:CO/xanthine dehydrogenase Mo-binding subunit
MTDTLDRSELKVVGTRPVRPDGLDKVTGRALYGADFRAPGMLVGAIKRSPHAHARILSIDTRKAEALPGVKAVLVGADFPVLASSKVDIGELNLDIAAVSDNCMAKDKVLYEGHAVAAVAALSAAAAAEAIELIDVQYEVLPHVIDVEAAMRADAPVLHDDLFTQGLEQVPDRPSNIGSRMVLKRGNAAEALAAADVVVRGRYTTQPVHQGYIEPIACVASAQPDGQAQIWCCTQGAFIVRGLTAGVTGMKLADLRVTPSEIGGGFGGKTTVYLEPVALLLSRKCGRPVKLVMRRDEVFKATGPASGTVTEIAIGANKDGSIVAAEIELKYQAGAFCRPNAMAGVITAVACYKVPNFSIVGWDVVCNMPATHAYRAPNAPQSQFAVESVIDEIARKIGMDPLELRARNAVMPGDTTPFGTTYRNINFAETLAAIKAHPHYSAPLGPNQGRGLAAGFWVNHGGESTAAVSIPQDGSVVVTVGTPDIGGSRASMAMMAAEVLGIPYERVRPVVTDTASIGFSMPTGGSRVTFSTGKAVIDACEMLIVQMKERAAAIWGVEPDQVAWENGQAICRAPGKDEAPLSLATIAAKAGSTGGPLSAETVANPHDYAPAFGVHLCDVEVDPDSGCVRVVRYTAAQDVGRAIHPSYVEGQIQGGAAQGIGWALNEAYAFDSEGCVENAGFLDYRMPVASDLPMIDAVMVEVPTPTHRFGLKGVGEVPIVPPLGAVANAVRDATGKRMCDLPLTPARIHAALHGSD